MKPNLILCLGNELRADDSFGPTVARQLAKHDAAIEEAEILYVPLSGFALLEYLQERRCVLIVDAIKTGSVPPGTLHWLDASSLSSSDRPLHHHRMSLSQALALARVSGLMMPQTLDVLAVEIENAETISENMTDSVSRAVTPTVDRIKTWIHEHR